MLMGVLYRLAHYNKLGVSIMCRCCENLDLFLPDNVRDLFFRKECPVERVTFPFFEEQDAQLSSRTKRRKKCSCNCRCCFNQSVVF